MSVLTRTTWPFREHPVDFRDAMTVGLYRAFGLNATDGDTVRALVDFGWYRTGIVSIRLAGWNCEETRGTTGEAYDLAMRALDRTLDLTKEQPILLEGTNEMSFRRGVAGVFVPAPSEIDEPALKVYLSGKQWTSLGAVLGHEGLAEFQS